MTSQAGSQQRERDDLVAAGTRLFLRVPESVSLDKLMDPAAVPAAIATGTPPGRRRRRRTADVPGHLIATRAHTSV